MILSSLPPGLTSEVRPRRPGAVATLVATTGAVVLGLVALSAPAYAATTDINLGTSAPYSVLSGQSVTNTGPSTLSGDLGVSPGAALTGFPPGIVGGAKHAADATAGQAKADLTIAYLDAFGRPSNFAVAGDLVGRTLVDGVYTSSGSLALSGTLTFDGQGDPNSVFIVRAASTLITGTASHVNAINGAQVCHIYWQVGSSATLGTASTFQGTIMALQSITVTTSAHVKGRALARNGSVTLDNNVFTSPDCSNTSAPGSAATTTTTLTVTPTSTTKGTSVTLSSTVTSTSGVPTGTVTFTDNGIVVGTAAVHSGRAVLHLAAGSTLPSGTVTATYGGSPSQAPSTSGPRKFTATAIVVAVPAASSTTPTSTSTATNTGQVTTTELATTGTRPLVPIAGTAVLVMLGGAGFLWFARRKVGPQH